MHFQNLKDILLKPQQKMIRSHKNTYKISLIIGAYDKVAHNCGLLHHDFQFFIFYFLAGLSGIHGGRVRGQTTIMNIFNNS